MSFLVLALLFLAPLQAGSTYSITGDLRDSEGKAAAGIYVSAYTADPASNYPNPPGRGGLSDADGKFVIHLDKPGKYILIYNDGVHGHVPQYISFFRDPNNLPPQVVLTEVTPTAQVDITMSKNGVLSGQVIDGQTQLPIDHATFVMCHAGNRSTCWNISAKSADGNFSIPTTFVPFSLTINSAEFETWFGLTGNDRDTPVSVPAGTNRSVRFLMKRRAEASDRAISENEKRVGINLPAPKQLSPEDNQVFDVFPRLTKLEWDPVDGAVSYGVEVDVCEGGKQTSQCINPQPLRLPTNPPTLNIMTTRYEFNFIGAQPGRWRVWAVDKAGRDGFKSSWRTFVYLK
jgi:hypothetical protein